MNDKDRERDLAGAKRRSFLDSDAAFQLATVLLYAVTGVLIVVFIGALIAAGLAL